MKSKSARWFAVLAIVIALIGIDGKVLSAQEESAGANYVSPHLWTVDVGRTLDQGIALWTAAFSICALLGVGGYIGLRLWLPNLRSKAAISFGVGIAICGIWIGSAALRAGKVEIAGGHVGVIYQQGRDVAQIGPGLHFIIPWRQRVRVFYARDFTFATISDPHNKGSEDFRTYSMDVTTSDGVQATVKVLVQARLDATRAREVYRRFGTLENAIEQLIKAPLLGVILRDSLQGYSAQELYVDISAANENVGGQLRSIMEEGGLEYIRFSFRRPELGQWAIEYNAAQTAIQEAAKERELVAVEEAKANQAVKQAEGNKQKVILEAEGQAAAAKAKAVADADAAAYSTRQQAEADLYRRQQAADAALYEQGKQAAGIKVLASAEADAIRLKAEAEAKGYAMKAAAVTPDFIELVRWQNWNGQLPTWTMTDTSSGFIFDVPAPQATSVPPAKPETP